MITPAVLLSACSSLILSTSSRLGRVVDRVRDLSDRFEQLAQEDLKEKFAEEKRAMIFHQMDRLTSRATATTQPHGLLPGRRYLCGDQCGNRNSLDHQRAVWLDSCRARTGRVLLPVLRQRAADLRGALCSGVNLQGDGLPLEHGQELCPV